jgi:glutamate synthase domain-containing protein 2
MTGSEIPTWLIQIPGLAAILFILLFGAVVLVLLVLFVVDIIQRKNAIRHNYPLIGRLRYLLIHLGTFLRQYMFAMDREEQPFNRAQREAVEQASTIGSNIVGFGSTRRVNEEGAILFANGPFATLGEDVTTAAPLVIGPGCRHPYAAPSFFNISAMSFGALSRPAVLALSRGAARAKCWMNTGEGGLAPYHLDGGCDVVFQIGTAKYGVRDAKGQLDIDLLKKVAGHEQVRMVEVKLAQGAKPGKGGILPGRKVTPEIAEIRSIPVGHDSISPNRHTDIGNIGELLDFIARVRDATGKPTGFKTVIGEPAWLDALCAELRKRPDDAPDFITVDSADGGSGAAPQPLIDYVGLLVSESLPLTVDALKRAHLRDRVRVIASGKLITASPVAWALAAGADFVNSARGFMFALGCIQAMRCHLNTCPTGVTTHSKHRQAALDPEDKAARVANYVNTIREEVGIIAHSCGVPDPRHLERRHIRVMTETGRTVAFDSLFPEQTE